MEQTIVKICIFCKNSVSIELTNNQIQRIKHGEHIQNVAPYLTPDEREIMISGICGPCFDQTIPEPEEDEELELPEIIIHVGDYYTFHIRPLPFGEGGNILISNGESGTYQTFGEEGDQHIVASINEDIFTAIYDGDEGKWKVVKRGITTSADTWTKSLAYGYYNYQQTKKEDQR